MQKEITALKNDKQLENKVDNVPRAPRSKSIIGNLKKKSKDAAKDKKEKKRWKNKSSPVAKNKSDEYNNKENDLN